MKFGFLKSFFGKNKEYDTSNLNIDEKNDYAEEKKNKFIEEEYLEDNFYIHENPKSAGETTMSMEILEPDQSNPQSVYVDENGRQHHLTPNHLAGANPNNRRQPPNRPNPNANRNNNMNNPNMNNPNMNNPNMNNPNMNNQNVNQNVNLTPNPNPNPNPNPAPVINQFPPFEVAEIKGNYHLFLDLAGVQKEEISIVFENSALIISGKRDSSIEKLKKDLKSESAAKKKIMSSKSTIPAYLMTKFSFRFPFNKMIDESAMIAQFTDGVLHITLPHRVKGDKIEVAIM